MLKCIVCGKEEWDTEAVKGEWFESATGKVVCSRDCRDKWDVEHPGLLRYSRITGYLSEIHGWNKGKMAELGDRVKYEKSL